MRIEEKTEIVEAKVIRYIADDGSVFDDVKKCQGYEDRIKRERAFKELESYLMDFDSIPINTEDFCSEQSEYRWYKVPNKEVYDKIVEYYGDNILEDDITFPTILCIEETYGFDYNGDCYSFYLEQMFSITENFFKNLGYEVEFKEVV